MTAKEQVPAMAPEDYGALVQGETTMSELQERAKAAKWREEREKNEISFTSFQEAFAQFKDDYAIVGHAGEPVQNMFDEPRKPEDSDHPLYSVSGIGEMSEQDFLAELKKSPVAIAVLCMDARGVNASYHDLVQKMQQDPTLSDHRLIVVSMGGGIVQTESITQQGKTEFSARGEALKTILSYLDQVGEVSHVYATGHDCRCGACAFYEDGVGVPEKLGVDKGSEEEQKVMSERVATAVTEFVPATLHGKTEALLAHFELPQVGGGGVSGSVAKESFSRFIQVPLT